MARIYRETESQKALCRYVSLKYPDAIFNCDCSGLNLSKAQAGQAKVMRSDKGFPDFVLYEPRNIYHGLFIEIKKEGTKLYHSSNIDSEGKAIWEDDHITNQQVMLEKLRKKGYDACFGIGLSQCIRFVDAYMEIK
jgi:hypothetical protein